MKRRVTSLSVDERGLAADHLSQLPTELLSHIVWFLDIRSVVALLRTSSFLRDICSQPHLWKALFSRSPWAGILEESRRRRLKADVSIDWKAFYGEMMQKTIGRPSPATSLILPAGWASAPGGKNLYAAVIGGAESGAELFGSLASSEEVVGVSVGIFFNRLNLDIWLDAETMRPVEEHRRRAITAPNVLVFVFSFVDQLSFYLLAATVCDFFCSRFPVPRILVGTNFDRISTIRPSDAVELEEAERLAASMDAAGFLCVNSNDTTCGELVRAVTNAATGHAIDIFGRSLAAKAEIVPKPSSMMLRLGSGYEVAMQDYVPTDDTELAFVSGDVLEVLAFDVNSLWAQARLRGRIGWYSRQLTELVVPYGLAEDASRRKRRRRR